MKFVEATLLGSSISTGDGNSRVGTATARMPNAAVTTNIQASSRVIRTVDTDRAVLTT
jgi:hypothetical protein